MDSQAKDMSTVNVSDAVFNHVQRAPQPKFKKPPPPVKQPGLQQTFFFDLPREVRDLIYDYYWLANAGLIASSTPFHRLRLQLRYHGQYELFVGPSGYDKPNNIGEPYPTWLLASKQLLTEALEQFTRKASWFWADSVLSRTSRRASTILDASKIHSMILYIGYLDYEEDCGIWSVLPTFADALGLDRMHGTGIRYLRISGWSHRLPHDGDFEQSALFIAQRLLIAFKDIELQTLELEICNRWTDRRRMLYEVVRGVTDINLVVKMDEKRSFPLLCNIARPLGRASSR